jgi:V/A-type H+-transporting ATPase subunit F
VFRLGIITAGETGTGFRLAGAEALEHLRYFITLDYGLVAVSEALLEGTEDERGRLMRGRDLPIIVPFPAPQAEIESGEAYIARLVKEHIGFYVKLR